MLLALRSLVTPPLQELVAASISVAVTVSGGPTSTELAEVADSFSPTAATTQNFVSMRATTPANLGDADASTETARTTTTALGPASAPGSAVTEATVMADPSIPFAGSISHVVFRCLAYVVDVGPRWGGSWGIAPNSRMRWTVGTDSAESALINDDPAVGGGTPSAGLVFHLEADGFDPGDFVPLDAFLHTANIATQPNGQPWTLAALQQLSNVKVMYDYPANTEFADLNVCEIWADIYGPQGTKDTPIRLRLGIGQAVKKTMKMTTATP